MWGSYALTFLTSLPAFYTSLRHTDVNAVTWSGASYAFTFLTMVPIIYSHSGCGLGEKGGGSLTLLHFLHGTYHIYEAVRHTDSHALNFVGVSYALTFLTI